MFLQGKFFETRKMPIVLPIARCLRIKTLRRTKDNLLDLAVSTRENLSAKARRLLHGKASILIQDLSTF